MYAFVCSAFAELNFHPIQAIGYRHSWDPTMFHPIQCALNLEPNSIKKKTNKKSKKGKMVAHIVQRTQYNVRYVSVPHTCITTIILLFGFFFMVRSFVTFNQWKNNDNNWTVNGLFNVFVRLITIVAVIITICI